MKAILNSVCINEPSTKCFAACKINIMGNLQLLGAPLCSSPAPGSAQTSRDDALCGGMDVAVWHWDHTGPAAPIREMWSRNWVGEGIGKVGMLGWRCPLGRKPRRCS